MAEDARDKRPPPTEADIEAYTNGGARRHDAAVHLVDYDPQWPGLFIREAARIKGVLGHTAIRIEHVGSTSVPCLAAKPIIDSGVGLDAANARRGIKLAKL